jgi:hypothetical protein
VVGCDVLFHFINQVLSSIKNGTELNKNELFKRVFECCCMSNSASVALKPFLFRLFDLFHEKSLLTSERPVACNGSGSTVAKLSL